MIQLAIQWLLVALLAGYGAPVLAASQVWRCGADGRHFSDQPCSDGSPHELKLQARSDGDVQAARRLASRDEQLAESLAAEREQRSQVAPGAGLIAIGPLQAELKARERDREISRLQSRKQPRLRPQPSNRGTSKAAGPSSRRTPD